MDTSNKGGTRQLVSIVTSAYNCEKWIGELAQSILDQTYPNLEWIVVDDGSTDKTEEVVRQAFSSFQQTSDRQRSLIYIKQKNGGVGQATLNGFKHITGNYYLCIDADNRLRPSCLSILMNTLRAHPNAVFVQPDVAFFEVDGSKEIPLGTMADQDHYQINPTIINSNTDPFYYFTINKIGFLYGIWFVDLTKFRQINPTLEFAPSRLCQDSPLLAQLYLCCNKVYISDVLADIRIRKESLSHNHDSDDIGMKEIERTDSESLTFLKVDPSLIAYGQNAIHLRWNDRLVKYYRDREDKVHFKQSLKTLCQYRKKVPQLKKLSHGSFYYRMSYLVTQLRKRSK